MDTYTKILADLQIAYDLKVEERELKRLPSWKLDERRCFLRRLTLEKKKRLLDLGAGTGRHAKYFQQAGMTVLCLDASVAMVRSCESKGLRAIQMDILQLGRLEEWFDAVFAMNSLIHVPIGVLHSVLESINQILVDQGLFYWGQYGGVEQEGVYEEDHYEPQRYFSFLTDTQFCSVAETKFELMDFHAIELLGEEIHFQSLTLRKKAQG